MQKAIEVLEEAIEERANEYNYGMQQTAFKEGALFAINHLKCKVKKDPRADGLPEVGADGKSAGLLVWVKRGESFPRKAIYNNGIWEIDMALYCMEFPTDEILFYADPNEIL